MSAVLDPLGSSLILLGSLLMGLNFVVGPDRLDRLQDRIHAHADRILRWSVPSAGQLARRFWKREWEKGIPHYVFALTAALFLVAWFLLSWHFAGKEILFHLRGSEVATDEFLINVLIWLLILTAVVWAFRRSPVGVVAVALFVVATIVRFLLWYFHVQIPQPDFQARGVIALLKFQGVMALHLFLVVMLFALTPILIKFGIHFYAGVLNRWATVIKRLVGLARQGPKGILLTVGFWIYIVGCALAVLKAIGM